ncbi:DUF5675 family protein [Roseateles sp. BYS96W]|uniref:DUF5675 family protein n=1 Tax=Pelomonas nitida TaxID=3299027 RepID=A0ABW7G7H5_9BURK
MRRAVLTRSPSTDEGTFGVLQFDGQVLHTTELPWRDNATGASCIPTGTYRCEIVQSPKFGRVYGVRDVPGRSNILIHAANYGGDKAKGLRSELLGCIAPCMVHGQLNGQMAGLQSRQALTELMAWAAGAPFELEIR